MTIREFSPVRIKDLLRSGASKLEPKFEAKYRTSASFFNAGPKTHTVCVEPWGEDYTLATGEHLEVVAFDNETEPWFETTSDYENSTQVWCNDAITFEVLQGARVLKCGHNRVLVDGDA
jgi:hypothetical protein